MLKKNFSQNDYPHLNFAGSYLRIRLVESCKKVLAAIEQQRLDDIRFSVGAHEAEALSDSARILIDNTILGGLNAISRKAVVEEMFNQLATKPGAVFTVHKTPHVGKSDAEAVVMTAIRVVTRH